MPKIILSKSNNEVALSGTDLVFYDQTSMCSTFALSGIPTIQVRKDPYHDILLRNSLCKKVNSVDELIRIIENWDESSRCLNLSFVRKELGFRNDYAQIFKNSITRPSLKPINIGCVIVVVIVAVFSIEFVIKRLKAKKIS
ncbi:MAG: hypothetical protein AAF443_02475 [Chlamydiota bacterium]